jgi:hypothetical protein
MPSLVCRRSGSAKSIYLRQPFADVRDLRDGIIPS